MSVSASDSAPPQATMQEPFLSSEEQAIRLLGRGPVLLLACEQTATLRRLQDRRIPFVAIDTDVARAAMHRRSGFDVLTIDAYDELERVVHNIPGICLGASLTQSEQIVHERLLGTIVRLLAPSGRLIIVGSPSRDTVQARLAAALEREGLAVMPLHDSSPDLLIAHKTVGRPAQILWEGSIDGEADGSLAYVNREHLRRLVGSDPRLHIVPLAHDAQLPYQDPQLGAHRDARGATQAPDIVIRHRWPPDFQRPACGTFVLIQPWEYGALPIAWRDAIREHVDEVWCHSQYLLDMYRRAGVREESMHLVPHGIDTTLFTPPTNLDEPRPSIVEGKRCVFTFVGGTLPRKGADVAIAAYLQAFSAEDEVCLIIKASGGASFYRDFPLEAILEPLRAHPNPPAVIVLEKHLDPPTLAELYRNSQALLCPFRGEGFGMTALEAMGCGTPIVYTAGGAMDDFLDERFGYPIPAQRITVPAASLGDHPLHEDGWLLEPDVATCAAHLRRIYEHPEEARQRGLAAALEVHSHWTWEQAVQVVHERLLTLAARHGVLPRLEDVR